jgi:hypothetical protein
VLPSSEEPRRREQYSEVLIPKWAYVDEEASPYSCVPVTIGSGNKVFVQEIMDNKLKDRIILTHP